MLHLRSMIKNNLASVGYELGYNAGFFLAL